MTEASQPHRVVISATCFADASSVIEIGCFLAQSTRREVQAVLIEEEAIHQMVGRPGSRVVPIGGLAQTVTRDEMIAAFKRDAAAYERAIREGASRRAVHWSFEKRRGQFPLALSQDISTGDLIVFGYQSLLRGQGETLVVDYANDLDVSMVELASNVAHELRTPLHVVLLRKTPDAAILVSEHSRRRMQKLSSHLTILDKGQTAEMFLDDIRKARVASVVISSALVRELGLNRLLDAARCPVIVYSG